MPWIILDRDGVINYDSDNYIRTVSDWQPIPGSIEAIASLSQAGWQVTVATNQSGIGRGLLTEHDLQAIHERLLGSVEAAGGSIHSLTYCPHTPNDMCFCRKPQPGLYHRLAERLGSGLVGVPVVGDSNRDLEAAIAVGARPILVRTGKGGHSMDSELAAQVEIYADLAEVAARLIQEMR